MATSNQGVGVGRFNNLIGSLEKSFGRGILMPLDGPGLTNVESIPTGSYAIDDALGIGGVPRGRIIEIYGPEASGKTTLALSLVAEAQKQGGSCVFVDAEHALNLQYLEDMGCDPSRVLVSQPDCGEDALGVVDQVVRSGEVSLVVVDSVAALIPRSELEGDMDQHAVGTQARLMSKALRKLIAVANKSGTTIVFINQIRMKIGVLFGSPETTTGGNALKFYASVRLDIRRSGTLKDKQGEIYGHNVRIKVVKNKFAPPARQVSLELHFGEGFDGPAEVLQMAVARGVMRQCGSYYKVGDETFAQGRAAALELLRDPQTSARIRALGLSELDKTDTELEPVAA